MKKTLFFVAAVAAALTASAQSFVTTMGDRFSFIPPFLTADGQGRMEIADEIDDNLTMHVQILNSQLQTEAVHDITCTRDSIVCMYEKQENDSTWDTWNENYLTTISPMSMFCYDISIGKYNTNSFFAFSQTLFNTTADYEYVVPVLSGTYTCEYDREEYYYDWEHDTTIYRTIHYRKTQTKIPTMNIMAVNGNTIGSIQAPDGYTFSPDGTLELVRMGNNWYIVFGVESMTNGSVWSYAWYRIDRQNQKINLEKTIPMRVYPNVVDRGQDITVELGDGMQATELEVVNTLGQGVKRVPVQPGQREVHIGTADLNRGMNFINSPKRGAVKIIVK